LKEESRENMKSKTSTKFLIGSSIALGLAFAAWSPLQAKPADAPPAAVPTDAQMAAHCKEMNDAKVKFADDVKAQNALLTEEVTAMNGATDEKKLGLLCAVVTRMAEQRVAGDARRAAMDDSVMHHFMQHTQIGKDSMSKCPMCKGADEKSPGSEK